MDKYRPIIGKRPLWAHPSASTASLINRSDRTIAIAAELDRMADIELAHGHSRAAELLAHRAAAMREAAQ